MTDAVLDPEVFLALLDTGGSELAAELAEQLAQDFARIHGALADAQTAWNRHADWNFKEIHMLAHELKGLALTIGANNLPETSLRAETLAKQKEGATLAAVFPALIRECGQVRAALAQYIESLK
ncbi:Hpt domain-containing protein [Roseinatronobacter sp. NSM]|uniref:Hpt domain-containing protein n=1 Tax=Roseinatronobacter sp. NSM TaxID=3457785 RepID=UPI0040364533